MTPPDLPALRATQPIGAPAAQGDVPPLVATPDMKMAADSIATQSTAHRVVDALADFAVTVGAKADNAITKSVPWILGVAFPAMNGAFDLHNVPAATVTMEVIGATLLTGVVSHAAHYLHDRAQLPADQRAAHDREEVRKAVQDAGLAGAMIECAAGGGVMGAVSAGAAIIAHVVGPQIKSPDSAK